MRLRDKVTMTVLTMAHLGVALWHGSVHAALAVRLSRGEAAFVTAVIFVAPLIAVPLLWSGRPRVGAWIFLLSMLGALVFGVHHHYVAISPDNVAHLPSGSAASRSAFGASAAALAGIELASAVYGAFCLGSLSPAGGRKRDATNGPGESRGTRRSVEEGSKPGSATRKP
jgi:hypothetical protein